MRVEQKKQAEDFSKLMETAHNEIRKAMESKDIAMAQTLLEDCQNGAEALGNLIEKSEGEGFITVRLLEEYCELLYQIYHRLPVMRAVDIEEMDEVLRNAFARIADSMRQDIETTLEAVFLPYKASMWDSLESIWQAAVKEPNCNAYVIPIPYYNKNPDGSFGKLHNEWEQYPEYVPVMKYEDYDFEKRKPDMIFIHNPYDEYNYVTSVHPFFYARNLKKFTGNLIYVPYFILNEINPDNQDELKSIEPFCFTSGVIHADKVIVQSENMRKAYIKALAGKAQDTEKQRRYWERKILGIGSPKVDKVLNTGKENVEIPKDWLKVIERKDGSRKKVILYNTSVGSLLKYEEKMLDKMHRVFQLFWEKREDIALLWRPHPLVQATIEAMRPQLWEDYQNMARKYRREGWGIYDDTPQLARAIAVSDGYYGDWSSLIPLCKSVGMPVMVQNPEV